MRLAIAVMARAPIPGRCKTRLLAHHPAEWVAELQRAMLEDTLARLAALPAAVRIVFVAPSEGHDVQELVRPSLPRGWTTALQKGEDLGARLSHAMRELFATDAGARAVIVGTDCPHLPLFDPTLEEDVLVGPADDGGYYLVAPRVAESRLFHDVAWSTSHVLTQTLRRCAELGLSVRELSRSYDVDEPADLERLAVALRDAPELAPRTARVLALREDHFGPRYLSTSGP
ncbi:Glycosyltransferase [Labilithrix luteola]|uniref:Glycosyltransferase n=1 Tax=Labilithrix luteola TaxID=1391654 RepID=A0A0K1QFF9_9BACT|nr:TIGR04282 family arsenosugar biosynthesis glycosyltransferase [Labilithrix luteola]AKV04458.1 Glycosyltransferase [Labilithrix luteola]